MNYSEKELESIIRKEIKRLEDKSGFYYPYKQKEYYIFFDDETNKFRYTRKTQNFIGALKTFNIFAQSIVMRLNNGSL